MQDALREEEEEATSSSSKSASKMAVLLAEKQEENWTGDESMQDAVLRMLVDKYKPLREGPIKTADEKLRERPPQVTSSSATAATAMTSPAVDDVEDIKPWMVTFKPPSFVASIRTGTIVSSKPSNGIPPSALDAPMPRQQLKRVQEAGRLTKAKEASLDYRLRMPGDKDRPRVNPVTLKGWGSLVEERIEVRITSLSF